RVGHVAVVQDEARLLGVRILVDAVDALGVEARGAALDAVHLVALPEQEFGEVGAVLAGDAGRQCGFFHGSPAVFMEVLVQSGGAPRALARAGGTARTPARGPCSARSRPRRRGMRQPCIDPMLKVLVKSPALRLRAWRRRRARR